MKQRSYRFLPEYANEKKERIKQLSANCVSSNWDYYSSIKKASDIAVKRIDIILCSAKRGFLTLDEAMHDISEVNVMEYVHLLRTKQYDRLPYIGEEEKR